MKGSALCDLNTKQSIIKLASLFVTMSQRIVSRASSLSLSADCTASIIMPAQSILAAMLMSSPSGSMKETSSITP